MKGLRLLLLALSAIWLTACSRPAPRLDGDAERTQAWSQEVVDQMASVPVQDNGRTKPLSVLAAFKLYYIHGRRDLKYSIPDVKGVQRKITLEPIEWLLDIWCYPRQAARYPLFRIEHSGVLDALGFANDGQKLDFEYLSYVQVYEVVQTLQKLARGYLDKESKDRSTVEEHIVQLWGRFLAYDTMHRQVAALHYVLPTSDAKLQEVFGSDQLTMGVIASRADAFQGLLPKTDAAMKNISPELTQVFEFVQEAVERDGGGIGLVAPLDEGTDEWLTLGDSFERVIKGQRGPVVDMIGQLQLAMDAETHDGKEQALLAYREVAVAGASAYHDNEVTELETDYYRASWHYWAIHTFLFAFLLATICWLFPRSKILWWVSMGVTILGLGALSYDLVLRCLITGRPPIKNLYDTFLFIAAVSVFIGVAAEFVIPRRIALAAAPLLGALLIMFARMFEVSNHQDTMDPLVAVLDSNFWLATHVTSINIGYAGGLAAAALANIWILMRVLRISHPSDAPAKALVRMTYGVTCFGLVFAVVGTILGGVWANDSWGRFWGWDPKENGALMICLSQIALLHARMSGWVRDFGFIIWAAVTGAVVVFSWFHVNLLGVGLHSYGFSDSMRTGVWASYATQLGFIVVGGVDVLLRPNPVRREVAARAAAVVPAN